MHLKGSVLILLEMDESPLIGVATRHLIDQEEMSSLRALPSRVAGMSLGTFREST